MLQACSPFPLAILHDNFSNPTSHYQLLVPSAGNAPILSKARRRKLMPGLSFHLSSDLTSLPGPSVRPSHAQVSFGTLTVIFPYSHLCGLGSWTCSGVSIHILSPGCPSSLEGQFLLWMIPLLFSPFLRKNGGLSIVIKGICYQWMKSEVQSNFCIY